MKPPELSFLDVMRECGFSDAATFVRVLKRNGFQLRRDKPVPFPTAQDIVRRLQQRELNAYRHKQEVRDEHEGGPLRWAESPEIAALITHWYSLLGAPASQPREGEMRSSLLGFVCHGGFLGDDDERPFVFGVDPGVNILIGERGAGKSTALNLFGVLSARGHNAATVLLTRLVGLLRDEREAENDKTRRIRQLLRNYSVARYSCFYRHLGTTFAYTVDLESSTCALLALDLTGWAFVPSRDETKHLPSMHVLEQGEVFKIADETNRYYLNVLVDALFPALREHREKFFHRVRKLASQYTNFTKRPRASLQTRAVRAVFDSFIDRRFTELDQIRDAVRARRIESHHVTILQSWYAQLQFEPVGLDGKPLIELFSESETSLWFVLFARTAHFLRREVAHILDTVEIGRTVPTHSTDEVTALPSSDEVVTDESNDPFMDEAPFEEPDTLRSTRDSVELLRRVSRQLRNRLRSMHDWMDRMSGLPPLDEPTKGLAIAYIDYLQDRSDIIHEQQGGCARVQQVLNQEGNVHRVQTRNARGALAEAARVSRSFNALAETYAKLLAITARTDPAEIERVLGAYGESVNDLDRRCNDLAGRASDPHLSTFFDPIDIELKQGSEYMPFEKLSFGQRSGIILKTVLGTTIHHIIVLDQPEDNLDAHAVEALATTLKNLGTTRQIIVATHHSSLVMGIPDAKLHVMESHGGTGVLREQGRLTDRELTRAVLNVLEGGEESFRHKMLTYADFMERLQGFIRDMEISEIESTFRRRTIDGLRNFLQPVVSSESMLRFYRHELRGQTLVSPDLKNARDEVKKLRDLGYPTSDLFEKIDRVIASIEVHINQFQDKIEELRMLDTRPHPEMVDVGALLDIVTHAVNERQGRFRRITLVIQPELRGTTVHFDPQHLRLIFENLFNNALRATEQRALDALERDDYFDECVDVSLGSDEDTNGVTLVFSDNGRGIPDAIREKLYVMRCSDQVGDHGLGGIIIRKMLDLNGSEIRVVDSIANVGTRQTIRLRRVTDK